MSTLSTGSEMTKLTLIHGGKQDDEPASPPPAETPEDWAAHPDQDLATRLYIAWMTNDLGLKSMDSFRRTYLADGDPVGQPWLTVAGDMRRLMMRLDDAPSE